MEKFLVSKAPYLRSADSTHTTKTIMRDLWIALAPTILFAIYKNVIKVLITNTYVNLYQAFYPLILLIVAPIYSILLESLCLLIIHKEDIKSFKDLVNLEKTEFGAFPGLFMVLTSPSYTPMWVIIVGITVGEVVGKMLFGGFGQNIFNPALVGRAFLAFTFPDYLSKFMVAGFMIKTTGNPYLTPYELGIDALAGATPLTGFAKLSVDQITYANVVGKIGTLWDFFLGTVPGALAETSALAILVGGIYLSIRKVIDYRIPLVYIGVVFITTLFIGLKIGQGIWYPTYQILSGGLFLGAFFMATEPVTSPKTPLARIIYAVFLGLLTVLFRLIGNLPEGVATAIVTMNIFGLAINQYCLRLRIEGKMTKRFVLGLVVMSSIAVILFIYILVFAHN